MIFFSIAAFFTSTALVSLMLVAMWEKHKFELSDRPPSLASVAIEAHTQLDWETLIDPLTLDSGAVLRLTEASDGYVFYTDEGTVHLRESVAVFLLNTGRPIILTYEELLGHPSNNKPDLVE